MQMQATIRVSLDDIAPGLAARRAAPAPAPTLGQRQQAMGEAVMNIGQALARRMNRNVPTNEMLETVHRIVSREPEANREVDHEVDNDGFQVFYINSSGSPEPGREPDVAPDVTLDNPTEDELRLLNQQANEDKEEAKKTGAKICSICVDAPVRVVFTGCGHATTCAKCTNRLNRVCPICRKTSKPIRLFS